MDWVGKALEEQRIEYKWKYIKRTGTSGNYRYWYRDTKTGKLRSRTEQSKKKESSEGKKEGKPKIEPGIEKLIKQRIKENNDLERDEIFKVLKLRILGTGTSQELKKEIYSWIDEEKKPKKEAKKKESSEGKKEGKLKVGDTITIPHPRSISGKEKVTGKVIKVGKADDTNKTPVVTIKSPDGKHEYTVPISKIQKFKQQSEPSKKKSLEVKSMPLDLIR